MKNYNEVIPDALITRLNKAGMLAWNDTTYADAFDLLAQNGIIITLIPFFTLALKGNIAYTWEIFTVDKENATGRKISEQTVYRGGAYGGSFTLTANEAIRKAIEIIQNKTEK